MINPRKQEISNIHSLSFFMGLFLIAISIGCSDSSPGSPEAPPNIILIMADDLGYGDLSSYGHPSIHTPHLDNMALQGAKFTDYHSNGAVCSPTRAALMSGKYQQRVGIQGVVYTWLRDSLGMSPEVHTLAEALHDEGYATALFGKWHLGYKREFNPIFQGFETFKGFVAGNVDYHSHLDNQFVFDWWENDTLREDPGYTTDLITQYALDYIKEQKHTPFFLYLPYPAPHDPYQRRADGPIRQPDQSLRELPPDSIPRIYKEMVEVLDEGIGKILESLIENGLQENTFVFFCSDNGANRHGSNGALRGFKGGLYEGGHRVPAIAYWPGRIEGGTIIEESTMSMDLYPTLLEIAGIPKAATLYLDGRSLFGPLFRGEQLPARNLFWAYNHQKALRKESWKLIVSRDQVELFDLKMDLGEQHDLSDRYSDTTQHLLSLLSIWEREVNEVQH